MGWRYLAVALISRGRLFFKNAVTFITRLSDGLRFSSGWFRLGDSELHSITIRSWGTLARMHSEGCSTWSVDLDLNEMETKRKAILFDEPQSEGEDIE